MGRWGDCEISTSSTGRVCSSVVARKGRDVLYVGRGGPTPNVSTYCFSC